MGNKTLTLNKPQATEPQKSSTSPIDRYETASVKLHALLITICGSACPGHETRMAATIRTSIDEMIDAAIEHRFEKEFGDDQKERQDA